MNILSIGNSFSQDAHHFLAPLAAACGDELWAVNLYIGGCSLETHWANFLSGEAAYEREETLTGKQLDEPRYTPEEDGVKANEALLRRIHRGIRE